MAPVPGMLAVGLMRFALAPIDCFDQRCTIYELLDGMIYQSSLPFEKVRGNNANHAIMMGQSECLQVVSLLP